MMMYTCYKKVALLTLMVLNSSMYSQETLTKTVEKTIGMTNAGELNLNNKYGSITVNGWNKNTIQIAVNIKVTNKKKENAESLFERINVEIKTAGDYISVASEFSDKNKSFFSRYFNKVNPFDFDKSNIEINYTINLPINAEIDVTNKFGDVILENWTGKLKANVQHGDLWINNSITNANIQMKFGKLRTKSISYASVSLKNGSVDIEQSKNLVLKTSGSTIKIDSVSNLELVSSKDELTIEDADKIQGELMFSNAQINNVNSAINLYLKVAELRISNINQPNAVVNIEQESSEIDVNISGLNFKFNATLEEGLLRLPKTFSNINSIILDKGKKIRKITAAYGELNSGEFIFTGKKGSITLKE